MFNKHRPRDPIFIHRKQMIFAHKSLASTNRSTLFSTFWALTPAERTPAYCSGSALLVTVVSELLSPSWAHHRLTLPSVVDASLTGPSEVCLEVI